MRSNACAVVIAAALLWSRPADADIITIEPDDFAAGSNLTAATPGVLLWTATITGNALNPLRLSAVYARHDPGCDDGDPFTGCYAFTGSQGFSPNSTAGTLQNNWNSARNPANCFALLNDSSFGGSPNACGPAFAGFTAMLVEFEEPAAYAEIGGVWAADFLELHAFDEDFHRLVLPQILMGGPRSSGGGREGTLSVTSPGADLKYVFFGSTEGGIALDRLRYEQVPEPSTILLTMAGLVGLCRHMRRRT
jgi:hypothetical protein